MQLPKEAVEEFKDIFKKEFRIIISDEEASKLAFDVLDFFKIVAKPIPRKVRKLPIAKLENRA